MFFDVKKYIKFLYKSWSIEEHLIKPKYIKEVINVAVNRYYLCPYCNKKYTRENLPSHVEKNHMDELPEGFTSLRMSFHIVNNKPITYSRPCRICKQGTDWDENKGRYNFLCNKKSCHDAWVEQMKKSMGDKMGCNRPTSTPEGLEKMLANRKISGKYKLHHKMLFSS